MHTTVMYTRALYTSRENENTHKYTYAIYPTASRSRASVFARAPSRSDGLVNSLAIGNMGG